ncbi:hypothetical protein A3K80_01915 [Candidatus Bathyarchaeota archaeon RBG_13_38_9]|nr:MAG: hypothetical protein A3K80_01915 [Candidatus Bathyarchaeota archaeon RBG_13_38_9]
MKNKLVILFPLLLFIASRPLGTVQAIITEPEPMIEIDEILFPERVLQGQNFEVNLSVVYSCEKRTMCNIGIYDYNLEKTMDPRMFYLEGNGTEFIMLSLQASSEKQLVFEALLRYWYLNGWVHQKESLRRPFSINVTDSFQLTLLMPTPNTVIKIDNEEMETDHLGIVKTRVKPGKYLVEVPQKINLTYNTRLSFIGWNDGSKSNPRLTYVQHNTNLSAEYEKEYYLNVNSSLGSTQGNGWYSTGSFATFSVPDLIYVPSIIQIIPDKYSFIKWTRDSDATTSISKIAMTSPKTVEANWQLDETPRILILLSTIIILFDLAILGYLAKRRRKND